MIVVDHPVRRALPVSGGRRWRDARRGRRHRHELRAAARPAPTPTSPRTCRLVAFTNSVQAFWTDAASRRRPASPTSRSRPSASPAQTSTPGCGTRQLRRRAVLLPQRPAGLPRPHASSTSMLQGQLGAKGGPFAESYVDRARVRPPHRGPARHPRPDPQRPAGRTATRCKLELMADCLAGVWAKHAQETDDAGGQPLITDLTQDDIDRRPRRCAAPSATTASRSAAAVGSTPRP